MDADDSIRLHRERERQQRRRAWITRRETYGEKGHSSSYARPRTGLDDGPPLPTPPLRLDLPDIEASDGYPGYGPVLRAILDELRAIRAALDKVTR